MLLARASRQMIKQAQNTKSSSTAPFNIHLGRTHYTVVALCCVLCCELCWASLTRETPASASGVSISVPEGCGITAFDYAFGLVYEFKSLTLHGFYSF